MRASVKPGFVGREDFSRIEKIKALMAQRICSLLMIIVSIVNAILAYVMEGKFHNSISIWIGIFSTLIFVLGVFTLIWAIKKCSNLKKVSEKWVDTTNSKVGRATLCIGSILFFLLLIFTFYHNIAIKGTFNLAESKGINPEDYKQFLNFSNAFSVLSMLLLAWTIYTSYIIARSTHIVRFMIYLVAIIQVLFAILVLLYSKVILTFGGKSNVKKLVFFWAVRLVIAMTSLLLFAICGLVFINFRRKWRMPYMIIGAVMLFLIVVLSTAGAQSIRNASKVDKDLKKDCKSALDSLNEETLKENGCPNKYLKAETSPYLNCKAKEQAIMWEQDQGKTLQSKENKIGCLNMKCCGNVSESYMKWLVRLGISVIGLVSFTFLNICCCFYMSNKFAGQRGFPKAVEIGFMALFALSLIALIVIVSVVKFDVKERNRVVVSYSIKSKRADLSKLVYYSKDADRIPQNCVKAITRGAYNAKGTCNDKCDKQEVRTSLLSTNAHFIVKDHWKQSKVKLLDEEAKYMLYGNDAKSYSFAGFQGKAADDEEFYKSQLNVCTYKEHETASLVGPNNYLVPAPPAKTTFISQTSSLGDSSKKARESHTRNLESKAHHKSVKAESLEDTEFAEENPLKKFDSTQFGDLHLKVISLIDGKALSDVKLIVYEEKEGKRLYCKKDLKAHTRVQEKSSLLGTASFYNLEYGTYTIFIEKPGFKVNCHSIQITKDQWKERLFLLPNLEKGQEAFFMTWKTSSLQVTTGATYAINEHIQCVVTNSRGQCGGMKYYSSADDNDYQGDANAIVIQKLAAYNYLFYVKEVIPQVVHSERVGRSEGLNSHFINEYLQGQYYVHELDYPAESMNGLNTKFPSTAVKDQVIKEKNLSYLFGCLNGEKSDKLKKINSFWYKGSAFAKGDNQQVPPPTLCNVVK